MIERDIRFKDKEENFSEKREKNGMNLFTPWLATTMQKNT